MCAPLYVQNVLSTTPTKKIVKHNLFGNKMWSTKQEMYKCIESARTQNHSLKMEKKKKKKINFTSEMETNLGNRHTKCENTENVLYCLICVPLYLYANANGVSFLLLSISTLPNAQPPHLTSV